MRGKHAGLRRSRLAPWGLSLGLWLASAALLWPSHGALLNWDEVDYVLAARQGVVSNALDRGSLSPVEFSRFALAKISDGDPVLPPDYDEGRDLLLLRHYHPPFVTFLLSPVSQFQNERVIRSVQLLGALALTVVIVLSYWALSGRVGWAGAVLVSLLVLWMNRPLFSSISFHGWEAVWTTATAALIGRWGIHRGWTAAPVVGFSLALAVLTLETGLSVWGGVAAWLLIGRMVAGREKASPVSWREMGLAAGFGVLVALALWPGALLKASFIKIPALYVYRIWLGEEYANVPERLPELFWALLPIAITGPFLCLWLLRVRGEGHWRWGPFVVIGGLYGIVLVPFALQPQYLLPALAPLVPMVGFASDRLAAMPGRVSILVVISLAIAMMTWPGFRAAADREAREDLHWLGRYLKGRETLVDGGHIYRYYLGDGYAIRPITVSYRGDQLSVREAGRYHGLQRGAVAGKVVVIQAGRAEFFSGGLEGTLLAGCAKTERPTVTVYDCPPEAR